MLGRPKNQESAAVAALNAEGPTLALQIVNKYLRWILVLLVGVILFLGYIFVLDAQIANVQQVASESLPTKIKTRDDLKSIKAELDKAVLDYEKIKVSKKEALDRIALLLPEDSEYGDLFTMLDVLTKLSGLKMTSMTVALPDDTKPQQRKGAAIPGAADDPVSAGLVRSLSIHVNVEGGTYETFKNYLEKLEKNVRLFDIKSVSLDGAAYIPSADGTLATPKYDIELITYYQP